MKHCPRSSFICTWRARSRTTLSGNSFRNTAELHWCPDLDALISRFQYSDFPHFIETWLWKNQFLREYDDLTFIAQAVAQDLARQNIRYAEMFFSPPDFFRKGLQTQRITEAVRKGLENVPEIEVALVADLVRDFGPERAAITLQEINEVKHLGVIGVGIGGSEQDYPPEPFEAVFAQARELGFHTDAHAGEAAGLGKYLGSDPFPKGGADRAWDARRGG